MPRKLKLAARVTALILLVVVASPAGFSDNEGVPTYRVANLLDLDNSDDAKSYARELSDHIVGLLISNQRSESPFEVVGRACEAAPKPRHCEEVSTRVTKLSNEKHVQVFLEEYDRNPHPHGELAMLSCSPSKTNLECYQNLVKRMAEAVRDHDTNCHRGKKCVIENGHFKPL